MKMTFEMKGLPTMSGVDLLLTCPHSYTIAAQERSPSETNDAARFGSATHECHANLMLRRGFSYEEIAKRWNVDDVDALCERALTAHRVTRSWIERLNPYGVDLSARPLLVEYSMALNINTGAARSCTPPRAEDHVYPDRLPDELPGTGDLFLMPSIGRRGHAKHEIDDIAFVFDLKTGRGPFEPAAMGQMQCEGLALLSLPKHLFEKAPRRVVLAIIHVPDSSSSDPPHIYQSEPLTRRDLLPILPQLRTAFGLIGSGLMRRGDHCDDLYCRGKIDCSAHTNTLIQLGKAPRALTTAEDVGRVHMGLQEFRRLDKVLAGSLREWVRNNGPGLRPDGRLVTLRQDAEYETVSKKSIYDTLPLDQANALWEQLRKKGVIKTVKPEPKLVDAADKG